MPVPGNVENPPRRPTHNLQSGATAVRDTRWSCIERAKPLIEADKDPHIDQVRTILLSPGLTPEQLGGLRTIAQSQKTVDREYAGSWFYAEEGVRLAHRRYWVVLTSGPHSCGYGPPWRSYDWQYASLLHRYTTVGEIPRYSLAQTGHCMGHSI